MTDIENLLLNEEQFDEHGNPIVIVQTPADAGDEVKPVNPV